MKPIGTASLGNGKWYIDIPPHVMIRFKRVFAKAAKWAARTVEISDTPENCRELLWFSERYPIVFEPRERLEEQARIFERRQLDIEAVISGVRPIADVQLALPPRDYQLRAAELAAISGTLLLADDLGLGKTVSAITSLALTKAYPAIVVTMAHLTTQWRDEILRFCPGLHVMILQTGQPYDLVQGRGRGRTGRFPDVIISNYHKLSGWAPVLSAIARSIVFDECQELRIPDSGKYNAAMEIANSTALRMGLSATPIFNYGKEIHSVLSVLAPDSLGTSEEFSREWCGSDGVVLDPKALGSHLYSSGLMLRRTRAEVGRELPALQRITHLIESDPAPLAAAESRAVELARIILGGSTVKGEKWRAAEEISHLVRQATGISKAPYVSAFVRMLVESGEKVVLYGWHRAVYDLWAEQLKDFRPAFYTGSESEPQKRESKRRFVAGETPVIILSNRSGAGLDGLQFVSKTVVHGELDWSPAVHDQSDGRVFRDGQKDPVTSWYLTTDSGSDPVIIGVLGLKKSQAVGIVDPNRDVLERLTVDPEHIKRLAQSVLDGARNTKPPAQTSLGGI